MPLLSETLWSQVAPHQCLWDAKVELEAILQELAHLPPTFRFLEIGTNYGATAATIASVYPEAQIATIDLPDPRQTFWNPIAPDDVGVAIRKLYLEHRVQQFRFDARELSDPKMRADLGSFDCVFVDGDHSETAVLRDCFSARALLRPGGFILVHDYPGPDTDTKGLWWTLGVWRAVDEWLCLNADFKLVKLAVLLARLEAR